MYDRWQPVISAVAGSVTFSAETFTPGAAPVTGYEGKNYLRLVTTGQADANDRAALLHKMEDVRTLAGQTATISFWAKAASGAPKIAIETQQSFGTGGSPSSSVQTYNGQVTLSTSWARYSVTISVPSISGKTIGTDANSSFYSLNLWFSGGATYNSRTGSLGVQNNTFDLWGVQVEAGSIATPFTTATGSIQGELAACQRYYQRISGSSIQIATGMAEATTDVIFPVASRVQLRVAATAIDFSAPVMYNGVTTFSGGSMLLRYGSTNVLGCLYRHPTAVFTAGSTWIFYTDANGFVGFSAEL
jgi:hypothetical protein